MSSDKHLIRRIKRGNQKATDELFERYYKEIYAYLDGRCSLEEAIETIKRNSRRYAKRQFTWFRREKNAVWIDRDQGDPLDEIRKYL